MVKFSDQHMYIDTHFFRADRVCVDGDDSQFSVEYMYLESLSRVFVSIVCHCLSSPSLSRHCHYVSSLCLCSDRRCV